MRVTSDVPHMIECQMSEMAITFTLVQLLQLNDPTLSRGERKRQKKKRKKVVAPCVIMKWRLTARFHDTAGWLSDQPSHQLFVHAGSGGERY